MMVAEYIAFPVSVLLAAALVLCVVLTAASDKTWWHVVRKPWAAVILLAVFGVLNMIGGTWSVDIQHRICLYITVVLMLWALGVQVSNTKFRLLGAKTKDKKQWAKRMPVLLLHGGLFFVLLGGMLDAGDKIEGQAVLEYKKPTHIAYFQEGENTSLVPLPFEIQLDTFHIDYYTDGVSPKQYTTRFTLCPIDDTTTVEKHLTTSVNHPCRYKGYRFYQSDYDRRAGTYSVLKIVHDPWISVVWIGVALLAIGACWQTARQWRGKWLLAAVAVVAVAFTAITLAKINFGTLVPALRSAWFVPHIGVYMLAYSTLAIAVVAGALMPWRDTFPLMMRLTQTASCLLLIGMLCGAVWAQQAWGDYWAWDPKECWAAATWMLTLAAIHLAPSGNMEEVPKVLSVEKVLRETKRQKTIVWIVVLLAFVAMQMTWYGVNYLPSAADSLHTYTN